MRFYTAQRDLGHRIFHDGPILPDWGSSFRLFNLPEIVFCSQAFCDRQVETWISNRWFTAVLENWTKNRFILLRDFEFMRYAALTLCKKDKWWLGD